MARDVAQVALYGALVAGSAVLLGRWMAVVYSDGFAGRLRPLAAIDGAVCRLCGADLKAEQGRAGYAAAVLAFNLVGWLASYAILLTQAWHPWSPQGLPNLSPWLAFNTAVSFKTGFWHVNSAHPFENPTALTNLVQMWAILAIPAAFCFIYGRIAATRGRVERSSPRFR